MPELAGAGFYGAELAAGSSRYISVFRLIVLSGSLCSTCCPTIHSVHYVPEAEVLSADAGMSPQL